ncbi:MAG TPA: hypothetical protein VE959_01155 [Bryobacteraceae bacterium]|nr:hypothetical protein [Bryobacteraceae bacterium]
MKRLYIALGVVFIVAVASQTTYSIDVVRSLQGDYPQKPFALGAPWPSIVWVDSSGYRAGLRAGAPQHDDMTLVIARVLPA